VQVGVDELRACISKHWTAAGHTWTAHRTRSGARMTQRLGASCEFGRRRKKSPKSRASTRHSAADVALLPSRRFVKKTLQKRPREDRPEVPLKAAEETWKRGPKTTGRQNDRRRATPPNVSNIQQGRLRGHLSKTVPRERGPSLGRERIVSRERGPSRLFRPSLRTV